LENPKQGDHNISVESSDEEGLAKNNSQTNLDIYLSLRLSLLGFISMAGLISFYYYHNDLVVTGITAGISSLTLLPLPTILKGTFDFFRNKKTVEAEKDKKLLGMAIQKEVKTQQSSFGDDLREVLSVSRTVQNSFETIRQGIEGVNQRIDGVNQRIDGVNQDVKNNFDSLTQAIVGVRQNSDAIENRLNSRLIAASSNSVDIQKQLFDLDRKVSSGQTEAHNDIQALNNRIVELSNYVNGQLLEIRQRSNPQE
jgi:hypothetical protein